MVSDTETGNFGPRRDAGGSRTSEGSRSGTEPVTGWIMQSLRWKFTVPIDVQPSPQGPKSSLIYLPVAALVAIALLLSGNPTPAAEGPHDATEQIPSLGGGLRSIVLDPGHGGRAAGAPGVGGLAEKDITLDIAVRLRELIYRRIGLQVFMTREDDVDLDLDTRTEKANNWQADLFRVHPRQRLPDQGRARPRDLFPLRRSKRHDRQPRGATRERWRVAGGSAALTGRRWSSSFGIWPTPSTCAKAASWRRRSSSR